MVRVGIPECQDNLSGRDFHGDRHRLSIEIVPTQSESECGVDPACSKMRECARNGCEGSHFSDGDEGAVGDCTDEYVGDESAEWASARDGVPGA